MGRNEFFAWIEQLNSESERADTTDRWDAAEQDDGWQKMRDKRKKWRGR